MLIPTAVYDTATLAVPGTDYWAGTAAHYYINPPGTGPDTACVWGSNSNPWGNWSPYVAGANQDSSGNTFIKLGWNPIYLEGGTPFRNNMPNWGVKIDCPNGGCNGLPCAIDPSENGVNQMRGGASSGAGGGNFCVVTVSKGSTANFVVYGAGGNSDSKAKGGQFWASGSPSSSTTTTTQSSTTTSTTTTAHSTTWSSGNVTSSTTTYSSKPSGSLYYSLFNNTAPSTTSEAGPKPTAPAATSAVSHLPSKGDASKFGMGTLGFMITAFWLL